MGTCWGSKDTTDVPISVPIMPSLLKRPNSPYWIAAFDVTQPDGTVRRFKKSTKKKNKADARIEALRLEEIEKRGNVSHPDGGSKAYAILAEAAEAAAKGELSEARAREFLARLTEACTGEKLKFHSVRSWAEDWLAGKAATGKKATTARYSSHIGVFLSWLGAKSDEKLESITKSDIRAFRDAIRAGWSPDQKKVKGTKDAAIVRTSKTSNHYAADVAAMFRTAVRESLLLASPCAALERLPEDDSIEREVFTLAEIGKLVASAGEQIWQDPVFIDGQSDEKARSARCDDWRGIILVGFYAGARLGDCAKLIWSNVDLDRKCLSYMPAKTSRKKKRLEVPLHPRLFEYLKARKAADGPIFPSQFAVPVGGRHGLSSQFIAIMNQAGIDRRTLREGKKGGQRAQHARSFHALRHSLTSNLANLDVSEEIRRRIVGHESADVHAKYTHTDRKTLARALEKLPCI